MTDVIESRYSKLVAGFTKLFSTIIHSTVWREEMHVKVVWVTMLAMADRNGRVFSSLPGLADASRVSLDQCLDALQRLSGPDPYSRTKEHEGRRIVEIDGGWELLNYLKYRETRDADERRVQTREAVRRYRLQKATVSQRKPGKPKKAQAEAEAEADTSTDSASAPPPPTMAVNWNQEAADDWRSAYGSDPPKAFFAQVKPVAQKYGWGRTRPALQAYLAETPIEYLNVAKCLAVKVEGKGPARGRVAPTASNEAVIAEFVRKVEGAK